MKRAISELLSGLKYLVAVFFMYAGITTALAPELPEGSPAGFVYSTRAILVLLGAWFFFSGFLLFYAKVTKNRLLIGNCLLSMYLAFLFGSVLNGFDAGWTVSSWLPNLIASFIIAALYLRWKYCLLYVPRLPRQEALDKFLRKD